MWVWSGFGLAVQALCVWRLLSPPSPEKAGSDGKGPEAGNSFVPRKVFCPHFFPAQCPPPPRKE